MAKKYIVDLSYFIHNQHNFNFVCRTLCKQRELRLRLTEFYFQQLLVEPSQVA